MKKIIQVLFIFFALTGFAKAQTTVTDYDGNTYQTVQIGNQIWMAENLKSIHYADGTPLVDGTGAGNISGDYATKYYFWFDNDYATYADTYGALYTWAAVMNGAASSNTNPSGVQGVCPDGWHVPSDTVWKELEMYLGMSQVGADGTGWRGTDEGGKLKETGTTHWESPNTGATNSTGFTALPGGYRYYNGSYHNIDSSAYFWSSAEFNSEYTRYRLLNYNRSEVERGSNNKTLGLSVRCVKKNGSLIGTYTIGPSSTDFLNFTEAVDSLIISGIGGPVVFEVESATYTEQISIPEISGASETNTICFQSETGDSSDVILTYSADSTNHYTLQLDGSDYVTFKELTLSSQNEDNPRIVAFTNNATHNTFANNLFTGAGTNGNKYYKEYLSSESSGNSYNNISGNFFMGGVAAIYFANQNYGNKISNNIFENQVISAILLDFEDSCYVGENIIRSNFSDYACGLYLNYCDDSVRVVKNKIELTYVASTGIIINQSNGSTTARNLIANNFISAGNNGITSYHSSNIDIYSNSINIHGSIRTNSSAIYIPDQGVPFSSVKVFNNNLINKAQGYAVSIDNISGIISNYNNLYTTGVNLGSYNNSDYTDIAAWQTTTGQDVNSISIDPEYLSDSDLHIEIISLKAGTPLPEVTDDIDGDIRNPVAPYIGADELTDLNLDSLALVALYNSTDGANWTDNTNWLTGNVSTWYGITVFGDRVTQIDLQSNNLNGTITPEIGNLSSLTNLDFYNNQLSGSIPPEIGNLQNLEILWIYYNSLTGSIPVEIGNLTNLIWLCFRGNQLSGSIPPEIGNLTNLTWLELDDNQFTGSIPNEIGNLTNLNTLYLYGNQLSGPVPPEITSLTSLQILYLNENLLTVLPDLSAILTISELNIQNNQFTFKDIEPNIGVASNWFYYSPQADIGEIIDTTVYIGTNLTLVVTTGGANNQYQWKKDGINIGTISGDSTYTLSPVTSSDAGSYTCEITNTVAPDLTLYSRATNVTFTDALCEMISNWEDITPPWESYIPATFIVDTIENPDKTGINPSDSCAKLITTTDDNEYMWYDLPGTETWTFDRYPVFKLMVNAPTEGDLVLGFINPDNIVSVWQQAHYSNPGLWEELIFDFTGVAPDSLLKMVIYPDYLNTIGGNAWYIDEIIHCDLLLNARIIDIIMPDQGCGLTNNEPITVQITNFGLESISNLDVSYQIDKGTIITETITSIIDPGDTLAHTFSTNADLYTTEFYQEYSFSANIMLTGNEGPQYNETIGVYGNYTDREGWTTFSICDGMAGDGGTTGVVEDGSGNIWVGTDEGVSVYNGTSWITYDTANSPLTSNAIETLYADDLGNVWIGTWKDEGGVCKYDGSTWTIYTTENSGIAGNVVEEIIKDSNGNYWFATYNGISKYDGTTIWTTYNTVNSGLVDDYTNAITEDSFGNIWIGTGSGVSKFDVETDTWTTYNVVNSGLGSDYIYAVEEDNQGNIWFGTDGGGITKFDGTTWTTYTTSNSDLPINRVFSIMADSNGNVWFGTFGRGAVKYDGTNWIIYNEKNGLVTRSYNDGSIYFWGDILEDSNGNIWFPAYNGLAKKEAVSIEIYKIEYSNSTCNGTNDGTITIYALAKNPPLQYSINGGTTYQSDNIFTGLAPGTYPITVTDGVNTVSTDVVVLLDFNDISSYPFIEDFDSYSVNSTEFNYGWFNETTNNLDWMVYSGSTPSLNTGPVTDQSGSGNYLYLEASAHYFYQGSLISPCFDISGLSNPTLKFYYHMSGTNIGELAVDIYSGGAWINNVMFASGDQGTDWLQYSTDLSSYGSIIKFRFRGIIGDTHLSDIAIDKIEVTGLRNENDILTYSFTEQTGAATIDAVNHTVAIKVALGTDVTDLVATFTISDLANITISTTSQVSGVTSNNFTSPVTYTVTAEDGTTQDWVVTVTVATSLSGENDILTYSFTEQTGPATINNVNHTISIAVANGTDLTNLVATFTISDLATIDISGTIQVSGVTSNNFTNPVTYTVTAENDTQQDWVVTVTISTPVIISSFPYQEDFETGNGDWYAGGNNSSWEYGIPSAGQTINSAASGNNAWVTNLTGDYYPDEISYVSSPQFDLSSLNFPKIEFNIWWYAEGFYDGANFQYKPGSGTWKTLGIDEGDDSWYNSSYLYSIEKGFGFDMNESAGWTGDNEWGYGSNGWVTVDHALTNIENRSDVRFRIAFASNSSYENDGVAIDDINIYDDPTGIDDADVLLSDIQIYPNPNEGKFRLVYNGERDIDLKLQLINLQGQVILLEQIETGHKFSKEFELDYLAPGIYYFRLMNKEGVVVKKMVVK